ncbi:MAG: hypothetical protein B0W54_23565 [Cellvibrio sp. 79]|nr:MAG: hypothetical protein B0W54_23565 [Cellvibrio sp. 79]
MLKISNAQMQAFSQQAQEHFVSAMVNHLRTYFPAVAWLFTAEELRSQINTCIERAAYYQLTTQQQVCRFLNIAATYGWEFDRDPDLLWMQKILTDKTLMQPGERLDHLVQTCLHRQGIEEHNLNLRKQLGLIPVEPVIRLESAEDYLGPKRNTDQVEPTTDQPVLFLNPQSYHLSKSLWERADSMPDSSQPNPAAPEWVNNSHPLLIQKSGGGYVSKQK